MLAQQPKNLKEKFALKKAQKKAKKHEIAKEKVEKDYELKRKAIKSNTIQNAKPHKEMRLQAIMDDSECFQKHELWERKQKNLDALENIIHFRAMPQSIAVLETVLRGGKIIALLLQDESPTSCQDLLEAVAKAEPQLKQNAYTQAPVNERRQMLAWVKTVIEMIHSWESILAKQVIKLIEVYNTGLQVCAYHLAFYRCDNDVIVATAQIANGYSLRECAKSLNRKENELRDEVLKAVKNIYKIAMTQTDCKGVIPPTSIPEIRQDGIKHVLNFDNLADIVKVAYHHFVKPFTQGFGIDLLNIAEYEREVDLIQLRLRKH